MQPLALKRYPGFAMLEVLVACLLVVSGVLGISMLFNRALGQARSALYRTAAVYLVDDLAESIRANAAAGSAYMRAPAAGASPPCGAVASEPDCSPPALAASDLAAWRSQVQTALSAAGTPSVSGSIASGAGETSRFRIQVLWYEPDEDEPLTATSDLLIAPPGAAP